MRPSCGLEDCDMKDRKRHYFGTFDTLDEAAARAAEARNELFGEFAGLG